jgi:beta-glucosidase
VTRSDDHAWPLRAARVIQKRATYTETAWEVFPQGLTDTLLLVKQRYGDIPLYVTENGAAFFDPPVASGGRIRDPLRIDYLRDHIIAVHAAIRQGVPVRGYMVWSLLDNLEWSLGFAKRFGIVHVDFETQKRTPKDSAGFYSRVIATNGRALGDPAGATRE